MDELQVIYTCLSVPCLKPGQERDEGKEEGRAPGCQTSLCGDGEAGFRVPLEPRRRLRRLAVIGSLRDGAWQPTPPTATLSWGSWGCDAEPTSAFSESRHLRVGDSCVRGFLSLDAEVVTHSHCQHTSG